MFMRLTIATLVATGPVVADEAMIQTGFDLYQQNCRTCHVMTEGQNRLGPSLNGMIGREVGSAEGFAYSGVMEGATEVWDEELLDAFLAAPVEVFPGNQMLFAGMPDAASREAVIAYIASESGGAAEEGAAAGD